MDESGVWRLAAAYDLTFTVNYKNRFIGDRHAMSIEESDRNMSRDQLMRLAKENDIQGAGDIIEEVTESVMMFRKNAQGIVPTEYAELISRFIQEQVGNL